jgi:hypothetical protein
MPCAIDRVKNAWRSILPLWRGLVFRAGKQISLKPLNYAKISLAAGKKRSGLRPPQSLAPAAHKVQKINIVALFQRG